MNSQPGGSRTQAIPHFQRRGPASRISRRQLFAWFTRICAAAFVSALVNTGLIAQETSDGIRVMAREKSLAEQFLVIMNDFGRKDITQYAKGVTLYAEAKAGFDGLITQLEHEVEQAR